jgi:hypothetical protein
MSCSKVDLNKASWGLCVAMHWGVYMGICGMQREIFGFLDPEDILGTAPQMFWVANSVLNPDGRIRHTSISIQ